MRWRPNPLIAAILLAIAAAYVLPHLGSKNGPLLPEITGKIGVALIFFLNGALISFSSLRDGARNWRGHLLTQGTIFVAFPLLGFLILGLFGNHLGSTLSLGLFYLCALPSTVSSSVAITAQANGNVALAMFNATASSLLGIFITPFWMSLLLHSQGVTIDIIPVLLNLILWMGLPLTLGQLSRVMLQNWLEKYKKWAQLADRTVIIWLIYTSFCQSFEDKIFQQFHLNDLIETILFTIGIFIIILLLILIASKPLRINTPDLKAIVFCGATKSLASGVPMAQLIFMSSGLAIGPLLLPILIYHPLQLFIFAIAAEKYSSPK